MAWPKFETKKILEKISIWQFEVFFSQMKQGMNVPPAQNKMKRRYAT
jgi:hypothetical protein